jgi:hypothetical protein
VDLNQILNEPAQREIAAAFARHGYANLSGAVEALGGRYLHGQLRVYRAAAQRAGEASDTGERPKLSFGR